MIFTYNHVHILYVKSYYTIYTIHMYVKNYIHKQLAISKTVAEGVPAAMDISIDISMSTTICLLK